MKLRYLRSKQDANSIQEFKAVKHPLFLILDQKEIFWRQRSKKFWLQAGDKNTRYFHAACSTRQRTNRIQKLRNDNGEWVDWQNGLQSLITQYYKDFFMATLTNCNEVISYVPQTISQAQNMELTQEVTQKEVKFALFQMHPDKAPGPDGMMPAFFQKHR